MAKRCDPEPSEDFVLCLVDLLAQYGIAMDAPLQRRFEQRVRQEFGAQSVYIHRLGPTCRAERDASIKADRSTGKCLRQIAKAHGVSLGTVHNVLSAKGHQPASVQDSLEIEHALRQHAPMPAQQQRHASTNPTPGVL